MRRVGVRLAWLGLPTGGEVPSSSADVPARGWSRLAASYSGRGCRGGWVASRVPRRRRSDREDGLGLAKLGRRQMDGPGRGGTVLIRRSSRNEWRRSWHLPEQGKVRGAPHEARWEGRAATVSHSPWGEGARIRTHRGLNVVAEGRKPGAGQRGGPGRLRGDELP